MVCQRSGARCRAKISPRAGGALNECVFAPKCARKSVCRSCGKEEERRGGRRRRRRERRKSEGQTDGQTWDPNSLFSIREGREEAFLFFSSTKVDGHEKKIWETESGGERNRKLIVHALLLIRKILFSFHSTWKFETGTQTAFSRLIFGKKNLIAHRLT